MTNRGQIGIVLLVLAQGLAGCGASGLSSVPSAPSTVQQQTPSSGNPGSAFSVADVTLSGFVTRFLGRIGNGMTRRFDIQQ